MALHCDIVASESVEGHTEYTIKIVEGSEQRVVHRRYSDFHKLDKQLVRRLPRDGRPVLPPKGVFGLRHRLGLFDFNSRRQVGLEQYLNKLLQTDSARAPVLDQFLADAAQNADSHVQSLAAAPGQQEVPTPSRPGPSAPAERPEGPPPPLAAAPEGPIAARTEAPLLDQQRLAEAAVDPPVQQSARPEQSQQDVAEEPKLSAVRCHLRPSVATWMHPLPKARPQPPAPSAPGLGSGRRERTQAATPECTTCLTFFGVALTEIGKLLSPPLVLATKVQAEASMEEPEDDRQAAKQQPAEEPTPSRSGDFDSLKVDNDDIRRQDVSDPATPKKARADTRSFAWGPEDASDPATPKKALAGTRSFAWGPEDASDPGTPMSGRASDTPTGRLVDERRVEDRWRSAHRPLSAVLGAPSPEKPAEGAAAGTPEAASSPRLGQRPACRSFFAAPTAPEAVAAVPQPAAEPAAGGGAAPEQQAAAAPRSAGAAPAHGRQPSVGTWLVLRQQGAAGAAGR